MSSVFRWVVSLVCTGQMGEEFYQDFRGGGALDPAVRIFVPEADQVATREAEVLRIRLGRDSVDSRAVGVQPTFKISGDFEITGTYEILSADGGPFGPRVNLRVMVGQPMREAADLARYRRIGQGDVYFVNRATAVAGGQPRGESMTFPAETSKGKLRLRRVGSTLEFLVADGPDEGFRQLAEKVICPARLHRAVCGQHGPGPGGGRAVGGAADQGGWP